MSNQKELEELYEDFQELINFKGYTGEGYIIDVNFKAHSVLSEGLEQAIRRLNKTIDDNNSFLRKIKKMKENEEYGEGEFLANLKALEHMQKEKERELKESKELKMKLRSLLDVLLEEI